MKCANSGGRPSSGSTLPALPALPYWTRGAVSPRSAAESCTCDLTPSTALRISMSSCVLRSAIGYRFLVYTIPPALFLARDEPRPRSPGLLSLSHRQEKPGAQNSTVRARYAKNGTEAYRPRLAPSTYFPRPVRGGPIAGAQPSEPGARSQACAGGRHVQRGDEWRADRLSSVSYTWHGIRAIRRRECKSGPGACRGDLGAP